MARLKTFAEGMGMDLRLKEHCLKCAACELWLFAAMAELRSREGTVAAEGGCRMEVESAAPPRTGGRNGKGGRAAWSG